MIVKTLFQHEGRFALGEVEIKLLPGIPLLHVVGQPDSHIKECGIKLKSALRSCDLNWPQGHQIVVNLRPSYFRKSSSGADLAIALGFLALTGQLSDAVKSRLEESVIYGEVALDGRVIAPPDLPSALRAAGTSVLTGAASSRIRDGSWLELANLNSASCIEVSRQFDWDAYWNEPQFQNIDLHPDAAEAICLTIHSGLNVLVAGPQGSGKTTWARALYALTPAPEPEKMSELEEMFGEEVLQSRWRPYEAPHHSITPQAMVGGGSPIFPGVISRAHGGVLVMDEFLEFNQHVLEGLREPVENGFVEHARRGERTRFPANFQLIGTTNLCPCGKLNPATRGRFGFSCPHRLGRCRIVYDRLSGPVVDRFDLLLFSNTWLGHGHGIPFAEVKQSLRELSQFRASRPETQETLPDWVKQFELSHRRRNSLLRVARGFADLRKSECVSEEHYQKAYEMVVTPMEALRQFFG